MAVAPRISGPGRERCTDPSRRRTPPPLATRPVTLQAGYLGHAAGPWGGQRAIFTADGTLSRDDWGLTWSIPLDGGGLPVSKDIRIEIGLEAALRQDHLPACLATTTPVRPGPAP